MTQIEELTIRLNNLERAFLQSQNNAVNVTQKADEVTMVDSKVDTVSSNVEAMSTNITGNYDASKTYSLNEYVHYDGNLYRFIKDNGSGIEPTNTLYWTLCDIATELNRLYSLIN